MFPEIKAGLATMPTMVETPINRMTKTKRDKHVIEICQKAQILLPNNLLADTVILARKQEGFQPGGLIGAQDIGANRGAKISSIKHRAPPP